jgi:hypothetical protein
MEYGGVREDGACCHHCILTNRTLTIQSSVSRSLFIPNLMQMISLFPKILTEQLNPDGRFKRV